jgi:hypothetical protein
MCCLRLPYEPQGSLKSGVQSEMTDFANEFEMRLTGRYGEFVPPSALWKELGFATPASFRKALSQARIEVAVFEIAGRRGSFARALDVARWQANVYANRRHSARAGQGI